MPSRDIAALSLSDGTIRPSDLSGNPMALILALRLWTTLPSTAQAPAGLLGSKGLFKWLGDIGFPPALPLLCCRLPAFLVRPCGEAWPLLKGAPLDSPLRFPSPGVKGAVRATLSERARSYPGGSPPSLSVNCGTGTGQGQRGPSPGTTPKHPQNYEPRADGSSVGVGPPEERQWRKRT